jgi:hypothetical protein
MPIGWHQLLSRCVAEEGSGIDDGVVEEVTVAVRDALGLEDDTARQIVRAFRVFVAGRLADTFSRELKSSSLAARNPYVYAALGYTDVDQWAMRVFEDKLTSSAEGLIGNFLEEVARIVSGGTKPGAGTDLQIDVDNENVELYAIQLSRNTKNAGARRSDLASLERAAQALRAQRRHVRKQVAVLFGRGTDTERDGVRYMSSEAFWAHITKVDDFAAKLLHACTHLSRLLGDTRADIDRVVSDAERDFGDARGGIDWKKVANPPAGSRRRKGARQQADELRL